MEEKRVIKAHCPTCGPGIRASVEAEVTRRSDDEDLVWVHNHHRILECCGCQRIYFQEATACSENIDYRAHPVTGEVEQFLDEEFIYHPPPAKRSRPSWMWGVSDADKVLFELLDSVYKAFDADLNVLAAVGVRTCFDKATEVLGIDPAITFEEKLKELVFAGHIGKNEHRVLKVLTEAGNAAAHRGWKPSDAEIEVMIGMLESFILRSCLGSDAVDRLASKVPPKPKRRAGSAPI